MIANKMTKNLSSRDRYLMEVARVRDQIDVDADEEDEEKEGDDGEARVGMGRGAKIFLSVIGAALGYVGVTAIVFSLAMIVR